MAPTDDLLAVSADWPVQQVEAGEVLMAQGDSTRRLAVLLEGALEVRHGDEVVATIDTPGACVGEISLLLDQTHHSTVTAVVPTRVRVLADADRVLPSDPALLVPVASVLAGRLRLVSTYLADLKEQYGESHPGLDMVGDVLGSLTRHCGTPFEPGSDRQPDVPY